MAERKFKPQDRVVITKNCGYLALQGKTGMITSDSTGLTLYPYKLSLDGDITGLDIHVAEDEVEFIDANSRPSLKLPNITDQDVPADAVNWTSNKIQWGKA